MILMICRSAMELRKAADALLRSPSSPLAGLLTPSVSARWATASSRPSQRAFASSARRHAADSQPSNPAATESAQASPAQEAAKEPSNWTNAGLGGNSSSRILPLRQKSEDSDWLDSLNGGHSAADLLGGFNAISKTRAPRPPVNINSPLNLDGMLSPKSDADIAVAMRKLSAAFTAQTPKAALRLEPKTGRTVSVGGGIDVGRAFRLLGQSCSRNGVRRDFQLQRFHERGGLKRKRLRRERWRKRFMDGFRATVDRVKEMKRQGW